MSEDVQKTTHRAIVTALKAASSDLGCIVEWDHVSQGVAAFLRSLPGAVNLGAVGIFTTAKLADLVEEVAARGE